MIKRCELNVYTEHGSVVRRLLHSEFCNRCPNHLVSVRFAVSDTAHVVYNDITLEESAGKK